ncbi:MAG: hypothetical protein J6S63_04275 [Atopobiaceae bacterium]|nr:hypothetical protein [Atopobiaceae bacterium]
MKRFVCAAAAAALSVAALTGCTSTYYTQVGDTATYGFNNLNESTSKTFNLPYPDIKVNVEVEKGKLDVDILDVLPGSDDDHPTVVDILATGIGIAENTSTITYDQDGTIAVRVTGTDATGKIIFEKAS